VEFIVEEFAVMTASDVPVTTADDFGQVSEVLAAELL
jgi:hypothetical protein